MKQSVNSLYTIGLAPEILRAIGHEIKPDPDMINFEEHRIDRWAFYMLQDLYYAHGPKLTRLIWMDTITKIVEDPNLLAFHIMKGEFDGETSSNA